MADVSSNPMQLELKISSNVSSGTTVNEVSQRNEKLDTARMENRKYKEIKSNVILFLIFISFLTICVSFYVNYEGWTIIKATAFVIETMTTVGTIRLILYVLSILDTNCISFFHE